MQPRNVAGKKDMIYAEWPAPGRVVGGAQNVTAIHEPQITPFRHADILLSRVATGAVGSSLTMLFAQPGMGADSRSAIDIVMQ